MGFLHFTFIDFLDIVLTAYLLYELYMLIRGTVALKIFIMILIIYVVWLSVKAFNMRLLSNILGSFVSLGIVAILIVFQQEVKRFLLAFGNQYRSFFDQIENFLAKLSGLEMPKVPIDEILKAVDYFAKNNIGALIVIARQNELSDVIETGTKLNANVSAQLLQTIFFKNSPLHDGATIIKEDKIVAAGCILPLTERKDLPQFLGLRHRAALGLSENTDAFVIVVSEERGEISYAEYGNIIINISIDTLKTIMEKYFKPAQKVKHPKKTEQPILNPNFV